MSDAPAEGLHNQIIDAFVAETTMNDMPERIWLWRNQPNDELVICTPGQPYPTGSTEYIPRAVPAVQRKVKPLVWEDFKEGGCIGKPYPFQYFITQGYNGKYLCHHDTSWHDDLAAAQARAQAAYHTAALEPAVQPDAAAIRDKVLREVLGNLGGVELFGRTPQDMHAAMEQWSRCRDMIYAMIDNPGKEVI